MTTPDFALRSDVLILGAGPAGSTCASLLAQAGHRVVVLEKETFPRFHVGESLLPAELALFQRLNLDFDDPSRFVFKQGAAFLDERSGDEVTFSFANGLPNTPTHAYQVDRAEFDHILANKAIEAGAQIHFGARARRAQVEADEVSVTTACDRVFRARYLVDATGQNAFLATQERTRRRIDGLGLAAVGCRYDNLHTDVQAELTETGNVLIFMLEDGWAWTIPLAGGRMSVGRVSATRGLDADTLATFVAGSPTMQRLTAGATRSEPFTIGNFSYKNDRPAGARFACIGDSACFLDPVFSSGVTFAMLSGEMLADILDPALRADEEQLPDLAQPILDRMQHAYDVFGALCGRFYQADIVRRVFFYDSPDPAITPGIVSVLAGDIFRDDNVFQNMLLKSRRRFRV